MESKSCLSVTKLIPPPPPYNEAVHLPETTHNVIHYTTTPVKEESKHNKFPHNPNHNSSNNTQEIKAQFKEEIKKEIEDIKQHSRALEKKETLPVLSEPELLNNNVHLAQGKLQTEFDIESERNRLRGVISSLDVQQSLLKKLNQDENVIYLAKLFPGHLYPQLSAQESDNYIENVANRINKQTKQIELLRANQALNALSYDTSENSTAIIKGVSSTEKPLLAASIGIIGRRGGDQSLYTPNSKAYENKSNEQMRYEQEQKAKHKGNEGQEKEIENGNMYSTNNISTANAEYTVDFD